MANLTIDDIIGNDDIKAQLKIALGAAKLNNRQLPHMLLAGRAGCGKTTTAQAIAEMGGSYFREVSPDALRAPEDLVSVFDKFPLDGYDFHTGEIVGTINPAILFIDEAHRLSLKAEEMLGIAMENWTHSFTTGKGRKKENITAWVPRFTLICATTMEGLLSKPFRDRFKMMYIFKEYSFDESVRIIRVHADKRGLKIDDVSIARIAQRSRGTPRLMVRYLERIADAMVYLGRTEVTIDLVEAQFNLMKIDEIGLTESDITILKTLHNSELPVGIDTLALHTNQDKNTIVEVNEPYLLKLGMIERSKQGRVITDNGVEHLIKSGLIPAPKEAPASRVLSRRSV